MTSFPVCILCDLRLISKPSVIWCLECNEGLCEDCEEHHTLSESSGNHRVIDLSDCQRLSSDVLPLAFTCSEHDKQYQMYCVKHDSPCCKTCISQNHNSCKEICPIDDIIHNVKTSSTFKELEQTLKEISKNHERIVQNRTKNLASLKHQKQTIESNILRIRVNINSRLDEIQNNLIKNLNVVEEKESQKIRTLLKSLEKKEQQIKEFQSKMTDIKQNVSDLQSLFALKHIKTFTTESAKHIQELISNDNLKEVCMSLNFDSTITSFSSSVKRFGEIFAYNKPTVVDIVQMENVQEQLLAPVLHLRSIDGIKLNFNKTLETKDINTGCVVLPDHRMVIACACSGYSGKIIILGKFSASSFGIYVENLSHITFNPDYNVIAVSGSSDIHILNIEKQNITKSISFHYSIDGIVYKDGYFIVCSRNKGIQQIDMQGKSIKQIVSSCVGSDANITTFADFIYYTDPDTSSVACCNIQGEHIWTFKEKSLLHSPKGIAVDNEGHVYVADSYLNSIIVISPDGRLSRKLLSKKDGINDPRWLNYDRSTDRLIVGNLSQRVNLYVYDVTK